MKLIYVKTVIMHNESDTRMKIIIADDNPEVRSGLRLLLEQTSPPITVLEISDTHSLFEALQENCPAAVFLDWELPGPKRLEFLKDLRSHRPEMKVIAMSSRYEARQEALSTGADAFVSKGEPPERILSTLHTLL